MVNNQYVYFKDQTAIDNYKGTLKNINRLKGLGEMSPDEQYDTLLNPETRNIIQIGVSDAEKAMELLEILMGTKVEPRKEYLLKYAEEAKAEWE